MKREGEQTLPLPVGGSMKPCPGAASWRRSKSGDLSCIKFPVGTEGEVKGCNKDHSESLKMPRVSSNED